MHRFTSSSASAFTMLCDLSRLSPLFIPHYQSHLKVNCRSSVLIVLPRRVHCLKHLARDLTHSRFNDVSSFMSHSLRIPILHFTNTVGILGVTFRSFSNRLFSPSLCICVALFVFWLLRALLGLNTGERMLPVTFSA